MAVKIPITTSFDKKGVEQAQREMAKLSGAVGDTQKQMSANIKKLGMAAGVAVIGAAIAGTVAFVDFERSMNEVFTLLPGATQQFTDAMTKDVKKFSTEFGVLPDKVVPALYQALSAGVPANNVFEFLEVAQKAAKGGVTDLTTAVDGITSVMNAYGAESVNATQASDLMFTAVRLGKTTFEEMSKALFQVNPVAAALGVKFSDVTAGLAAMTSQGIPTSVATTQLRQLFVELSKAGGETADTFEKIAGKSFKQFVAEGGNTQSALRLLEEHAGKTNVGINDLFGSVEAGGAALALTGKGTEVFTSNLEEMSFSAGATDVAFDQMNKGLGPIIDKFKAFAAVMLLEIGGKVAPVLEKLAKHFEENQGQAKILAIVVGGALVAAMGLYVASAIAGAAATVVAAAPIIAVVAAIAVVIAAMIWMWINWDKIWTKIRKHPALVAVAVIFLPMIASIVAFVGIAKWLWENWDWIWEDIQGFVSAAWDFIKPIWDAIWSFVETQLIPVFKGFWGAVAAVFKGIAVVIGWAWNSVIKPIWDAIYGFIFEILIPGFGILWLIIQGVWNGITAAIYVAWSVISFVFGLIKGGVEALWGAFQSARDIIGGVFSNIADGIAAPFRTAFNFISDAWNNTIGSLRWKVPWWVPVIGNNTIEAPRLPHFADGGMFTASGAGGAGLALLHDGEMVLNRKQQRGLFAGDGVGGGAVYNINVNVSATADKAAVGAAIIDAIAAAERRQGTGWRAA